MVTTTNRVKIEKTESTMSKHGSTFSLADNILDSRGIFVN